MLSARANATSSAEDAIPFIIIIEIAYEEQGLLAHCVIFNDFINWPLLLMRGECRSKVIVLSADLKKSQRLETEENDDHAVMLSLIRDLCS